MIKIFEVFTPAVFAVGPLTSFEGVGVLAGENKYALLGIAAMQRFAFLALFSRSDPKIDRIDAGVAETTPKTTKLSFRD